MAYYMMEKRHYNSAENFRNTSKFISHKTIHNDLFKMSVKQFERQFETLLLHKNRNGRQENGLLEDLIGKSLAHALIDVIGTEREIKTRQKMFIIQDCVNCYGDIDSVPISSGSLAEGLCIKGSDEDIMLILKDISVFPRECTSYSEPFNSSQNAIILMETNNGQPGFARLVLGQSDTKNEYIVPAIEKTVGESVISSSKFRAIFVEPGKEEHGPCITDGERDFAICLHCPIWPEVAENWLSRFQNSNWALKHLADKIKSDGCILVPIGPKQSSQSHILWRISFSVAERRLILSLNHTQILCYGLLKLFLKEGIESNDELKGVLCSYYLKTALFWTVEESPSHIWFLRNVLRCFMLCIEKLIKWTGDYFCPNYFVPENNMFAGKIHRGNNKLILKNLQEVKVRGYNYLCELPSLKPVLCGEVTKSHLDREAGLDFLCFRTIHLYPCDSLDVAYLVCNNVENMLSRETDCFARGVIFKLRASIHQTIAQRLSLSGNNKIDYKTLRNRKMHLIIGNASDLSSGDILLASHFHIQGRHHTALRLALSVIKRMDRPIFHLSDPNTKQPELEYYLKTLCGRNFDLVSKMRYAATRAIVWLDNSALLPSEFQPDVHGYRPLLMLPALVFAHALVFLCHFHLHDLQRAREGLSVLDSVVSSLRLMLPDQVSNSLTILGACYELVGRLGRARECYEEAMENAPLCKSAKIRLQKLTAHD